MKKILSLLLALVMVTSLFNGVTASAAGENLIAGLTPTSESVLPTSFAYLSDTDPANLTDGVIRSDSDTYKGNYTFNPDSGQIISFAYEKAMTFREINVATCNPDDLPVKGIKSLKAEALIDGEWYSLASVDNLAPDQPGQIYAFTSDTDIVADGVRVSMTVNSTGTGYNTISISEIQVFSEVTTAEPIGTMVINSNKMEKPVVSVKNGSAVTAKANSALTLDAVASVTDGGTISYQWYKDGAILSGQTRSILTFVSVASSDAGTYKVVATNSGDANPSSASAEVVLTVSGETQNLAVGAPYTWENYEGSILHTHSNYQDTNLKEMTDGYISTNVSYSDSGYSASNGGDITFIIDLQGTKYVEAVTAFLMSTNSAGITMPTEATFSYSTNKTSFTELGVWTQDNRSLSGIYAATVTAPTPVTARYIKVSVDGAGGLHFMSEAAVYGTSADGDAEEVPAEATNIALGRSYTSSMLAGSWYNANTTDNNYRLTDGTYGSLSSYNNTAWAGWLSSQSVSVVMDLGAVAKIYEVNTRNFNTEMHGITSAGGYEIYSSNDGISWTQQYVNNAMHGKEWLEYKPTKSFDARYLKIVVSQGNSSFIFLDEIEVIGVGGKTLPTEPDANTSAVQSLGKAYSIEAVDASGNAIANTSDTSYTLLTDGNTNNTVSFDGAKEMTFTLNLGTLKAVESINTYVSNISSMKVYLADSVVDGKVNWVLMDTVSASSYTFSKTYLAQFVKLVFTANASSGISEIEVIGKGNTAGAVSPTDGLMDRLTKLSGNMEYTSSKNATGMEDASFKLTDGNEGAFVGFDHLSGITRYVKFDLGDVYEVNAFDAVFSGDYLPSTVQMMVSTDNANWTLVNKVNSGITASNGVYKAEYILGEGVKAQYVMISFYKASGITALSEVSIYGGNKVSDGIEAVNNAHYMIPFGDMQRSIAIVNDDTDISIVDYIVKAGFDGVRYNGTENAVAFLGELNSKVTETMPVYITYNVDFSKFENLEKVSSFVDVTASVDLAKEQGIGVQVVVDLPFDTVMSRMDEMVQKNAQGRYVYKAVNLDFDIYEAFSEEEIAKIFESLRKLNKGTLKASNTTAPDEAELLGYGVDWVALAPKDGYEYSIDGEEWGKDPTFSGLEKGVTYELYQRIAETSAAEGSLYDTIFVNTDLGEVRDPDDIPEEDIPGVFKFNMYEVLPGEEFKMTFTMPETVVASSLGLKVEFDNEVFEIVEIPETPWTDMQPYLEGCNANANIMISWCDPTFDANTTIEKGTLLLEATFRAKEGVSLGTKSFVITDWNVTGPFNEETYEMEVVTPDAGTLTRRIKIVEEKPFANITGSVKAFGNDTDNVTIELISGTEVVDTTTVTGKSGTYTFENVQKGDYTVRASKTKHAPRDYAVTVADTNVTQDILIWLYGDVTGEGVVNNTDVMQINRYNTNNTSVFNQTANADYRFEVANVTAITGTDKVINNTDVMQINRYNTNNTSVFDRLA